MQAEAAARRLGFQVTTVDCDLAANAHASPLQPVYVWEHNEDSDHEKPKVLARLTEELGLSSKELQATAVFASTCTGKHVVLDFLCLFLSSNSIQGLHAGPAPPSASVSSD